MVGSAVDAAYVGYSAMGTTTVTANTNGTPRRSKRSVRNLAVPLRVRLGQVNSADMKNMNAIR